MSQAPTQFQVLALRDFQGLPELGDLFPVAQLLLRKACAEGSDRC
ncbi:hypothetical protein ACFWY6_13340 [Streptomyces sp. NPDC059037]